MTRSKAEPLDLVEGGAPSMDRRHLSPHTRRAYAADWRHFYAWCSEEGIRALPAAAADVGRYLTSLGEGIGSSALRRRLSAIAHEHHDTGHSWTGRNPANKAALRYALLNEAVVTRPAEALTSAEMSRLALACGANLIGLRDRALLLTAFAGSFRRSTLVALDREHLRFTSQGMTLRVNEGPGRDVDILRNPERAICPIGAMEAWLQAMRIEWGALFPRLSAAGRPGERLRPQAVWLVLRRRAAVAGLTVPPSHRLTAHGLRAGGLKEAKKLASSQARARG